MATNRHAATSRLELGKHSIDRVTPRFIKDKGIYLLDWSVRLHDGELVSKRSQGATKGEVRARAKAKAEELLSTSARGKWTTASLMGAYIEDVGREAIRRASVADSSKTTYQASLTPLYACKQHTHKHSLAKKPIAAATTFAALEDCVREISELHSPQVARAARKALNKYVLQRLKRDGLIAVNPIHGETLDYGQRDQVRTRGGRALTKAEYVTVLDWMLDLDPAEGVVRRQGRWSIEHLVNVRLCTIDLTLLQSVTGLRVSEANQILWSDLDSKPDGTILVNVRKEVSKTRKARTVPILDPRVTTRILARWQGAEPDWFVIGAPTNRSKRWDRDNCSKKTKPFYEHIWETFEIDLFEDGRTHTWRATLNTLMANEGVPLHIRAAYFGHDEAENVASYTDKVDTSSMVEAAKSILS